MEVRETATMNSGENGGRGEDFNHEIRETHEMELFERAAGGDSG